MLQIGLLLFFIFLAPLCLRSEAPNYIDNSGKIYEDYRRTPSLKEFVDPAATLGNHIFWRSAVLPGWSQFHRGDTSSGVFFDIATGASLFGTIYYNYAGNESYELYRNANTTEAAARLRKQTTSLDNLYSSFSILTITFYALNLLDAIVFGDQKLGVQHEQKPQTNYPKLRVDFISQNLGGFELTWKI